MSCKFCDGPLTKRQIQKSRPYCSLGCFRSDKSLPVRICVRCGSQFATYDWKRVAHCSWECYSAARAVDTLARRFTDKILIGDDCWLWTGAIIKDTIGYGQIHRGSRANRETLLAHRVSFELFVGPIADGFQVLHRCDTPRCVRPAHLFLGTQLDNMRDMIAKGRGRYANLG